MSVAAMIDLGVPEGLVMDTVASLRLEGYGARVSKVQKNGIEAVRFDFDQTHAHAHEHSHIHGHVHEHTHEHRNLADISAILRASSLSKGALELALKIFGIIAEAEGRIHGVPAREVHFHEVGAVDSIADIAAASACIDYLAPDSVAFSVINEGSGFVSCRHGVIPVPAPATLEILRVFSIPFSQTDESGEMVTPTGAGIAAAAGDTFGTSCPSGKVLAVGYGAGSRDFKRPNLLRVMLIDGGEAERDAVCVLECNIDDMTAEGLAFASERLFELGCLDVTLAPLLMKKGRPGTLLSVICTPEMESGAADAIFAHTTTLGIRTRLTERHILPRRELLVHTADGDVRVKRSERNNRASYKPEYGDLRKIAAETGKNLSEIAHEAVNGAREKDN